MPVTVEGDLRRTLGVREPWTSPEAAIQLSHLGMLREPAANFYFNQAVQGDLFLREEVKLRDQDAVGVLEKLAEELLDDLNPHISGHKVVGRSTNALEAARGRKNLPGYAVVLQWDPEIDLETPQRGVYIAANAGLEKPGVWFSTGGDRWTSVWDQLKQVGGKDAYKAFTAGVYDFDLVENRTRFAIEVVRNTPPQQAVEPTPSRPLISRLLRR